MRDLYNNLKAFLGLASGAKAKSGSPFTGGAIDLQGFNGALVVCSAAALGTEVNTYTFKLTECDTSGGSYTDVVAGDLLGDNPVFEYSSSPAKDESNVVKRFGYIGKKRYLKVVLTVAGAGTGGGDVSAVAVLGYPRHAPVD